jgi:hypothetical protein
MLNGLLFKLRDSTILFVLLFEFDGLLSAAGNLKKILIDDNTTVPIKNKSNSNDIDIIK